MSDLFNTDQTDQTQINDETLAQYIGPGGKFYREDVNEMLREVAKAKAESDNYIKSLEKGRDELREDYLRLREEYNTGPKVKELLDQFKDLQNTNSNSTQNAKDVTSPSLDPKELETVVKTQLKQYEAERRAQQNQALVESKLKEAYGDNYVEVFRKKVNELGVGMDWAKDTAASYPQVLFRTLGLDGQSPTSGTYQAPPPSTKRQEFSPRTETRDWNYYEKLRKEQPDVYWNSKTQVQLHKDSMNNPNFGELS